MFFENKGPFKLSYIKSKCAISGINFDGKVNDIKGLNNAKKNDISFLDNSKYIESLHSTSAGYCVLKEKHAKHLPSTCKPIISQSPLNDFIKISILFYPDARYDKHSNLYLSKGQLKKKYKKVKFGNNVHISKNVIIGHNTIIGNNVIIENGCNIGNNVIVSSNVIIKNTHIGNNSIISFGCVLGKIGFGYKLINNKIEIIPHIGQVIVGNNCNIGSYCVIDRGSFSNTKIGNNTSLDNHVHIAHNTEIGENCFIAGQVGIAGRTIIGNNVMIGGQAGVSGHLRIGNNVKIGGKSGVVKDINDNQSVMGYPAVSIKDFLKNDKK